MLFNSPDFLLFLPIVFGLYWFVVQRNLRSQNVLLLVASYVFYGWWDWRFLGLIAFSTVVDFIVGIQVAEANEKRIKKASNYYDDHHLVGDGARDYSAWLALEIAEYARP